jgi:hypothetical protein
MTGGAFGSLIAQFLHLTSAERKHCSSRARRRLSATFAAPLASVLLAVELLLFEWKPQALCPVAIASATAAAARRYPARPRPLWWKNENGLDGGRVEAVCRAPIWLLGIYELLRSGPTSMRERRSLFAAARFLSDPAAERVPHGPTHLRATSGPLGRQLAISLRTKVDTSRAQICGARICADACA